MLQLGLVTFREFLEISIFLSIVTAMTANINKSRPYIIFGTILGILGSCVVAILMNNIVNSFAGLGEEILQIIAIVTALLMIFWVLSTISQSRKKVQNLKSLVAKIEIGKEKLLLLSLTVAINIFREGSEIVVMVYGIMASATIASSKYFLGIILGSILGIAFGVALYYGLLKISVKYFFRVTSIFLAFLAAGLASQAAGLLTSSGLVNILSQQIWDTSAIVSNYSTAGLLFNHAFGYTAKPSALQLLLYLLTLTITLILSKVTKKSNA